MNTQQSRQSLAAPSEDITRPLDPPRRVGDLLTSEEACSYLRFTGRYRLRSLYHFLKVRGVPTRRRLRRLLIKQTDLDRALSGASPRQSQGAR